MFLIAVDTLQRYGESADNRNLVFLNKCNPGISLKFLIFLLFWCEKFLFRKMFCCVISHVQPFETVLDTLTASNVSPCHPYTNFCSVSGLLVAALKRAPSRHQTHYHRHKFLPVRSIPLSCVSMLEVVMFQ